MKYIISLDQGTTSSRALIIDSNGKIINKAQKEFKQIFLNDGWVEHDPQEIWGSQIGMLAEVLSTASVSAKEIAAIGITNQRETTIVWDRKSGKAIYNAIVWQDRRTANYCDKLKEDGHAEMIRAKTGLVLDAYFSGTKVKWILDNVQGARAKAEAGDLAFGTVDSWLIWNLTKGEKHYTDVTNASRTLLYDIHKMDWDDEILELLDIPKSMLPAVRPCSSDFGLANINGTSVPIGGVAGDQHAALFGQMCTEEGMGKCTYGTGCFAMLNTGSEIVESKHNLLSTIAWQIGDQVTYALEGSVFIGGAVIQWLRDGLKMIDNASEIEALANTESDNGGVYFVPAFVGIGAPYWDQYARGMMIGLGRNTTKGHIAKAAQEAIAYQVNDLVTAMEKDMGGALVELRVDGGASANNSMMQFQSDVLDTNLVRPTELETTALGAAYFAGLKVGYWKSTNEIKSFYTEDRQFEPNGDEMLLEKQVAKWHKAVDRCLGWTKD
ncbi:MAG: glycerol kinase [Halioglobus sp.]|jgi:glycerol kinase